MKRSPHREAGVRAALRAFSLVELVLALGIVSFALMAILGLIPVGLSSLQDSVNDTRTSMIVAHVRENIVGRPFTQSDLGPFFYDSEGGYLGETPNEPKNFYRVDVTVAPPDQPIPHADLLVARITVGWPIAASGTAPQRYQGSIYVAPLSGPRWETLDPNFQPKIGL